jgi:hypothetical protein
MTAGLPRVTVIALTEIDRQRRSQRQPVSGVISAARDPLVRLTDACHMASNINELALAGSRATVGKPSRAVWIASPVARMPAVPKDLPDA